MKFSDSYQSPVKKSNKKLKKTKSIHKENSDPWMKDSDNKNWKSSKPFADSTSKKSALANADAFFKNIPLTPN
jgi:hypothetical protein